MAGCSSSRARSSCTSPPARLFFPKILSSARPLLQWLFLEQYSYEPYIASVRFLVLYPEAQDDRRAILDVMRRRSYDTLGVMEGHLWRAI